MDLYTDEYFMKEALREAAIALDLGEVPVGAVVVCNNRIIGRGDNQTEKLTDATAHAEMIAITAAESFLGSKYLRDCTLYVTLEPCTMCVGAMHWVQLGKLVYGARDVQRGYSLLKGTVLHPKTEVVQGTLQKACEELIVTFFQRVREKH